MGAAQQIPELDPSGLRQFALTTAAIVAVLFGLFFPWAFGAGIPWWPWLLSGVLAAWGLAAPRTLRRLYRAWMRVGLLLNRVTTPLVLGVVFFVVILPFALAMKLLKRDPLHRRFDQALDTYRVTSPPPPSDSLNRPF